METTKRKYMSLDEQKKVFSAYKKGYTRKEISEKYNISYQVVTHTIAKFKTMKMCPSCDMINSKESFFCNMCGEKIVSENQAIAKDLRTLISRYNAVIPEASRNNFSETLQKAIKHLESEGK